jgi:hypothetical protein
MTRSSPCALGRIAICVAIDWVSTAALLAGGRWPHLPMALVAVALHLWTTAMWIMMQPLSPSRRWLCAAATLTVPGAGVAFAAVILCTRGRGTAAAWLHRTAGRSPRLSAEAARQLADGLSPCDAMTSDDDEQRRATLSRLARCSRPDDCELLHWAVGRRDPDLALYAALALDEIDARAYPAQER